jgi:hypothetical protein
MCNPGFYFRDCCGNVYGPNYNVMPPFPPFQGMLLGPGGLGGAGGPGGPGSLGFPTHRFARSPRDYFMIDVDPRVSPYTYGATSPLYTPGVYERVGTYERVAPLPSPREERPAPMPPPPPPPEERP